jgi:cell shape-determining protein MreD
MYFNPSWSHAHSAFAVTLFLWYWDRTRPERTYAQWALLGLCAGLMFDVYYPNGILMVVPLAESLAGYIRSLRKPGQTWPAALRLSLSRC